MEQKKSLQQLVLALLGIVALIFLFIFVGFPFLIRFSSFIAGFKNEDSTIQNESVIVLEPSIDNLPTATNSAQIIVTGSANSGDNVILYLNNEKLTEEIVGQDGLFSFSNVSLRNGTNEIYAISKIGNKESKPSETVSIIYNNEPPKLDIESPKNGDVFKRENRDIEIKGTTNEGLTVTLNDRFVFVEPNGSFTYKYSLSDGENKLEIKAIDNAGNAQTATITVSYEP